MISEWLEKTSVMIWTCRGMLETQRWGFIISDQDVQYDQNIAMIEFQIPNTWSSSGDNSLTSL